MNESTINNMTVAEIINAVSTGQIPDSLSRIALDRLVFLLENCDIIS